MPQPVVLLACLLAGQVNQNATREAPSYSATSVVNSASNLTGSSAPNTFLSIYGTNLAYTKRALADTDIVNGTLPTILPGTGVTVYVNRVRAQIYYVSPGQINILVPSNLDPGPADLLVNLDGIYGPTIAVTLSPSAPALFQMDDVTAIAAHANGAVLTSDGPGRPDEYIVLYATGLGRVNPTVPYGEIPLHAAQLQNISAFRVLLDGTPLEASRMLYAGVAPGFGGLYQINIQLPSKLNANPEIRLQTIDGLSKPGVFIRVAPSVQ